MRRILVLAGTALGALVACSGETVLGPEQLQFRTGEVAGRDTGAVVEVAASAGTVVVDGTLLVDPCRFAATAEGVRTSSSLTLTIETTEKAGAVCNDEARSMTFEAQLADVEPGAFQVLVYLDHATGTSLVRVGSKTVQVP